MSGPVSSWGDAWGGAWGNTWGQPPAQAAVTQAPHGGIEQAHVTSWRGFRKRREMRPSHVRAMMRGYRERVRNANRIGVSPMGPISGTWRG
jgi:hypothetical protein